MSWNHLYIAIKVILVTAVLVFTIVQLLELLDEKTQISISIDDRGDYEMPSFTFCPEIWEGPPDNHINCTYQDNMTLNEWKMQYIINVSDFFEFAVLYA